MATTRRRTARSASPPRRRRAAAPKTPGAGPLTLEQARALARAKAPTRTARKTTARVARQATIADIGGTRAALADAQRQERRRRIDEYRATLAILKQRGVKAPGPVRTRRTARAVTAAPATLTTPLQILAEGDSWFDYPKPFFGGGIVPRLESLIGVPILNLAKAGDEARYMLGVDERRTLATQLTNGCPAGGPWDVVLFSGGGNDIVDDPMCLWLRDFTPGAPAAALVDQPRFDTALALVRAAYEDLITVRDRVSPGTHLLFHCYDFAIPDGRGVCLLGPWMKPAFDLRGFPTLAARTPVVKEMLQQFATMLAQVVAGHANVSLVNGQGLLAPQPSSWDNELHPKGAGFDKHAQLFRSTLQAVFPGRVF